MANLHEESRRRRPTQPNVSLPIQENAWATDLIQLAAARPERISYGVQLEIGAGGVVMVCGGGFTPTAVLGLKLDSVNGPTFWETTSTGIVRVFRVAGSPVVNGMDEYTDGDGGEAA